MVHSSSGRVLRHRSRPSRGVLQSTSTNLYYGLENENSFAKHDLGQSANTPTLSNYPSIWPEVPLHHSPENGRTDACHICGKTVHHSEISAHLKRYHFEQSTQLASFACHNPQCGHTAENTTLDTNGDESRLCGACYTSYSAQVPRTIRSRSHMYLDKDKHENRVWRRIKGALTELEIPRYLQYKNRTRKDKDDTGKEIWPDFLEEAFQITLREVPPCGKKKVQMKQANGQMKSCGRNELIAEKLFRLTGELRKRKQISSHIQVLSNMIKEPEWLQYVKSDPSKVDAEASRGLHWDDVNGRLIFTDRTASNRRNNDIKMDIGFQVRHDSGTLPCPTKTLGSSVPSPYPSVQRIELDMSVYPPTGKFGEESPCHTYTQIQSQVGAQSKALEDYPHWRDTFPTLAELYDGNLQFNSEVILLESNLELMKEFSPLRSSLRIHLLADISCPPTHTGWTYRTRFYSKGQLSKECSGYLDSNRIPNSTRTRVVMPLSSNWWVQTFHEIMERRYAIQTEGNVEALAQHEDQTRKCMHELSVTQEMFVTTEQDGTSSPPNPAVTLLWKFRQTFPGEMATTSWRKLCQPPPHASTKSPNVDALRQQTRPDSALYTFQPQVPLQPLQVPLPAPLQEGSTWDEWTHVSREMYTLPDENMIAEYNDEPPFLTRLGHYREYSLVQDDPPLRYAMQPSEAKSHAHYLTSCSLQPQASQPQSQSMVNSSFGTNVQSVEYQLDSFQAQDQASNRLDSYPTESGTDISSQSVVTEPNIYSPTTEFTIKSVGLEFPPRRIMGYHHDMTDPSLESLASSQIQLSYEAMDPQSKAHDVRDSASPVAPVASMHHYTSQQTDQQIRQLQLSEEQQQQLFEEHDAIYHASSQSVHNYPLVDNHSHQTIDAAHPYIAESDASEQDLSNLDYKFETSHWVATASGDNNAEAPSLARPEQPDPGLAQEAHWDEYEQPSPESHKCLPEISTKAHDHTPGQDHDYQKRDLPEANDPPERSRLGEGSTMGFWPSRAFLAEGTAIKQREYAVDVGSAARSPGDRERVAGAAQRGIVSEAREEDDEYHGVSRGQGRILGEVDELHDGKDKQGHGPE